MSIIEKHVDSLDSNSIPTSIHSEHPDHTGNENNQQIIKSEDPEMEILEYVKYGT